MPLYLVIDDEEDGDAVETIVRIPAVVVAGDVVEVYGAEREVVEVERWPIETLDGTEWVERLICKPA